MNRVLILAVLALGILALSANPTYYPMTSIVEDVSATWCDPCADAYAGLNVLHTEMHPGEFNSIRYYTESQDYSSASTDERITYYDALGIPLAIFNGKTRVSGGGTAIADGSLYNQAMMNYRFADSPLKMSITSWNPQTGAIQVRVTMMSASFALNNASLRFAIMENNVTALHTRVTRQILTQPISMTGEGTFQDFTASFNVSVLWVPANLWAIAFVQLADKSIVQSVSSLTQPQYQIRAAMAFSPEIIDSANINFTSDPIWFFNTGTAADDYTIRLIKDSGPEDWYFNYCSENGECYPGVIPNPFSLEPGEAAGYHLNLIIGSSGASYFHYEVQSTQIGTYNIPFIYRTEDTPVEDDIALTAPVSILQNSPNPFSSSTSLQINAKQQTGEIGIDIYNAKGQLVQQLQAKNLHQGINEIIWNGTDATGNKLAQGVYFSKIKGIPNAKAHKMLIINN